MYTHKTGSVFVKYLALSLFLVTNTFAGLQKDHVYNAQKEIFGFQEVCKNMLNKEISLVDVDSVGQLDCMGTKVSVRKFCLKKYFQDHDFVRGYVDRKNQNVTCLKAKKVEIAYKCKKGDELCREPKKGCTQLRDVLAINHVRADYKIIKKETGEELNCEFASVMNTKL